VSTTKPTKTGPLTLFDCLDAFTSEEKLTGNEQYYCGKCKTHRDSTKTLSVFRFPPVIVLHLKRFSPARRKMVTDVTFPMVLDLKAYATPVAATADAAAVGNAAAGHKYELYAVSNHMGGVGGGHYTAHCRVGGSGGSTNWHTFNDSHVSATSGSLGGPSAYVLFYRRVAAS
jgi:ubiquitin C-terminal hydrolase